MKRLFYIVFALAMVASGVKAQGRTVQNRPYIDLRTFHLGVLVGTHLQDVELMNAGAVTITNADGSTSTSIVTADQDRWDAGFTVGVLGELRLSSNFQLRVAPAMYFGSRHITFLNFSQTGANGKPIEQDQNLKTAYLSTAFDLIFSAPRYNNHRPYIMAGINPMINLSGKRDDYIRLNGYATFVEIGVGCDFYLPYFKLRPELKFMYGLGNNLDTKHAGELQDPSMLPYTNSVTGAHTKVVALTFYFE